MLAALADVCEPLCLPLAGASADGCGAFCSRLQSITLVLRHA